MEQEHRTSAESTTGVIRLYFNRHGNPNRLWSIDYGATSVEILLSTVEIEGAVGITQADPNEKNPDLPKAWIQFYNAHVFIDYTASKAVICQ